MIQLETIDKLFLELSQFTSATTAREAELIRLLSERTRQLEEFQSIIGNIEQIRSGEGNSVEILCDNPEPETSGYESAVIASGEFTGWAEQRYHGETWPHALSRAAEASRLFNIADKSR